MVHEDVRPGSEVGPRAIAPGAEEGRASRGPPTVIAHRGASKYRPENTLSSIRFALELHAPAIEFDVRRTKDGSLVVMHDDSVDRTTNGSGRISELTLSQVRAFDAGDGEKVPTLAEVLAEVRGRATLFIEAKVPHVWKIVVETLQAARSPQRAVLISFLASEIADMKSSERTVLGGILFRGAPAGALETAVRAGADIVGFREDVIRPDLVGSAHGAGREVLTWTVDAPERAVRLAEIGVDYIASNAPDRILPAISQIHR